MIKNIVKFSLLFLVVAFFGVLVLFSFAKKAEAASYSPTSNPPLTGGFSGASCPGNASDWVAVRVTVKSSTTLQPINGNFSVSCKHDYISGGLYYEGPDGVHSVARYGARCSGGTASSGSAVCMGSCTLPFYLSATAPEHYDSPQWLLNHEAGVINTLYDEGNLNTANYSVYLDPTPAPPPPNPAPPAPTNLGQNPPGCSDSNYNVTLSWSLSGTVTAVQVEYWAPNKSETLNLSSTATFVNISGIAPHNSSSFFWKVRAANGPNWSAWTASSFTVPACSLPDLVVTSLNVGEVYAAGATVTPSATITNQGGTTISQVNNPFQYFGHGTLAQLQNWTNCTNWTSESSRPYDGQPQGAPFAAGQSRTYGQGGATPWPWSFTAPSTPGTYYVRISADQSCQSRETGDTWDGTIWQNHANNTRYDSFRVQAPVTNPSNLSASPGCTTTNGAQATFSWTPSTNQDGYSLEISTSPAFTTRSFKTLVATANSFTWNAASPMDTGSPLTPSLSTYYWRLRSFNSLGYSAYIYPPSTTTSPGASFTTSNCQSDLIVTTPFTIPNSSAPGSTVNVDVVIRNNGNGYANATVPGDTDNDQWTDAQETTLGTVTNGICSSATVDAWPADTNKSGNINSSDFSAILSRSGAQSGDANYLVRYDLNLDNRIDQLDLNMVTDLFGQSCTTFKPFFQIAINMNASTMNCDSPRNGVKLTSSGLGSLQNRTVSVPVTYPATPGTYTAIAMVDSAPPTPNCYVTESNEANNTRTSAAYTVNGFDLSSTFVAGTMRNAGGTVTQNFTAGETITVDLRVRNNAPAGQPSAPATGVGVWPNQVNTNNLPNCTATSQLPPAGVTYSSGLYSDGRSGNVFSQAPGSTQTITVSFPASATPGQFSVYSYAIPGCTTTPSPHPDYNWANNGSHQGTNVSINYTVTVEGWFETVDGDVCSKGNISQDISPVRSQSKYLLARNGTGPNATSSKWTLDNYTQDCVEGDVYTFMKDRIKSKAIAAGPAICSLSSLRDGLNYCEAPQPSGKVTVSAQSPPSSNSNTVWFIDGDLELTGYADLTDPADTLVFVVSGNITINTGVQGVGGIYIAGGTFRDTTNDTSLTGGQLRLVGAIYAKSVNLNRVLSTPTASCSYPAPGGTCNNTTHPAEVIIFDPKYLAKLSAVIGTPEVTWTEVAP